MRGKNPDPLWRTPSREGTNHPADPQSGEGPETTLHPTTNGAGPLATELR